MIEPTGSHGPDSFDRLLRELTDADFERSEPPAALWDRIEAVTAEHPAPPADRSGDPDSSAGGTVHPLRPRRFTMIALSAAAAIVLLIAGVAVTSRGDDDTEVIARAQLSFDETFDPIGSNSTARAELVQDGFGGLQLRIIDADLPVADGGSADLEVWLIEPDADANVADLVSLGLVDPDDPGTFTVPSAYDPSTFFVVDISVEPRDGDAAHSGRSILRGPLEQL